MYGDIWAHVDLAIVLSFIAFVTAALSVSLCIHNTRRIESMDNELENEIERLRGDLKANTAAVQAYIGTVEMVVKSYDEKIVDLNKAIEMLKEHVGEGGAEHIGDIRGIADELESSTMTLAAANAALRKAVPDSPATDPVTNPEDPTGIPAVLPDGGTGDADGGVPTIEESDDLDF